MPKKTKKKILIVGAARPNFMKIAPIVRELKKHRDALQCAIVHTGQHYDYAMSETFFKDLALPKPRYFLEAGSGSHAEQTAAVMVAFEKVCVTYKPDMVMVVGDVNSTIACALTAKKLCIAVAHVEAGLRSGDLAMPEEINRIATDSIADLLFVTEQSGIDNLLREGRKGNQVHLVGNVMIDTLLHKVKRLKKPSREICALQKKVGGYACLTLHRPSNVDIKKDLQHILDILREVSQLVPIIFPIHPRTQKNLKRFKLVVPKGVYALPPLSYDDFLCLWKESTMVLTDSGGIQEETTALGVPCLTLRENTERPITIDEGTNTLVGTDKKKVVVQVERIMKGTYKKGTRPRYWDGKASERIVKIILKTV